VPSLNGVDAGTSGKGGSGGTGGDTSSTDPGSSGGGGGGTQPDGGTASSGGSGGSSGGSGSGSGSGGSGGSGSGGSTGGTCPGTVLQSSLPAWKAPKTGTAGACNATDISALDAAAAKSGATYQDVYNSITSTTCRACVFSNETDAQWQLVVWAPDYASNQAVVNYGACYATGGGGTACGNADFQTETCLNLACPSTCADVTTCQKTAATGTCATELNGLNSSCGTQTTTLESKCDTFADAVNVVCGPGAG
jgi:hypothetical protein